MKIAHINFSLDVGGIETMLVDILNEQCAQADTSLILINDHFDADLLSRVDSRVAVHRIGRPKGSRNPFYLAKLNALLLRIQPDVIHCHNHQVAQWIWGNRGQRCLTVHDMQIPTQHFGRYNKLFAISESVSQDIQERSGFMAQSIYNGVQTRQIEQKTTYSGKGHFKVLQVSRLMHEKKGQHLLLEAVRQLVYEQGMTQLRVDFVGEGTSRPFLEELTRTYGLEAYVTFAGLKSRPELYRELKNYHLLVQPSLYEGFGLTIAEAMAAGVPVLVSAIDGPMELIRHNEFGYSFPSGDTGRLAGQISELVDSYESTTVRKKALAAQQYVRGQFDIRQTAGQYLANYL
ncbi:glycosyltransferase [Fibrella sp. ES10-3-2-2]|nr:hypothetical protein A6C57_20720 [Fibrella sp. ES10-3-2-2]